jgi:hypothetical protein
MLVKVLLFAYTTGEQSSRTIAGLLERDIAKEAEIIQLEDSNNEI